jgi:hypothetical protein
VGGFAPFFAEYGLSRQPSLQTPCYSCRFASGLACVGSPSCASYWECSRLNPARMTAIHPFFAVRKCRADSHKRNGRLAEIYPETGLSGHARVADVAPIGSMPRMWKTVAISTGCRWGMVVQKCNSGRHLLGHGRAVAGPRLLQRGDQISLRVVRPLPTKNRQSAPFRSRLDAWTHPTYPSDPLRSRHRR